MSNPSSRVVESTEDFVLMRLFWRHSEASVNLPAAGSTLDSRALDEYLVPHEEELRNLRPLTDPDPKIRPR